jgi:hypothetical protein
MKIQKPFRKSKPASTRNRFSIFQFSIFILQFAIAPLARAGISAEASLSSNQVGTGEPFQISVQVVSDEKVDDLPWPTVDGLAPFSVTKNSANSHSASTTIINGKVTQRNLFITTFTYSLVAKNPGNYQVGPIRYVYKDFDKMLGSAGVTVVKQEPGLVSTPSLSKRDVFVGEQVLYNLRIIPSQGVQQINLPEDLQKLIGEKFWFQRLDKNVEGKVVKINGQNARVFDIRIVLFPLLAGKAELAGIPVNYQQVSRNQRRRTGSVFDVFDDDFFAGGSVVQMTSTASPVSMEVRPLPAGAPQGFTGSVGDYSLSASVDKTSVASGDAVALTVTIKGDGQPKSVTSPRMPDLADFEVFDPEINVASAPQGSTLLTTKTFKYVVVPRRKGEYTIGPVVFPYFDPRQRVYAEAKSQPITISVSEGREVASAPSRVMSQREITDIGSDIRHIKTESAALKNEDDFLYKRTWFWFLFSPPPAALALLMVLRSRSRRLESDATLKRKTQASAHLRKRLKEASEAAKEKNPREFYKALSQAVIGFASDKLNVEFRGLTLDEAKATLAKHGVSDAAAQEYEKLLQQCDFGQFAGGPRDEKAWKEALAQAEDLLRRLEKEL